MKALITYNFKEKFEELEKLGYEIIYRPKSELIEKGIEDIKDIDLLVAFDDFDVLNLSDFPNLKWIQLLSTGINQVPLEEVNQRNISLTNNKLGYNIPIGEWIVYNVLQLSKKTYKFFNQQVNKIWKMDTSLTEVYGKNIGFLGTGDIAKEASKRLAGFGVTIFGINSTGNPTEYFEKTYSLDNMTEILPSLDFLIVTLPYTDKTHQLVGKDIFDKLKPGVSIINIARGTIIDEAELIKNLKSGKIKGAALDVFEVEPLPLSSPLWDMENVIVSPHNSWASENAHSRRYSIVYENMSKYIKGQELNNLININQGY